MTQSNILLESGTNELEIVEFFLDEALEDGTTYRGYYGVNVAKVLEIIRMPRVTALPEVGHKSIKGAFNLRAHIIPLIDLGMWLEKEEMSTEEQKVIVTEFNEVNTAFIVSGVNRIHRISWEQVEPPNKYVTMLTESTITGVVRIEERIIFLLDLERIVASLNPALALQLDTAIDWDATGQYRVLIAEDSSLIRGMLVDFLQKAAFTVEAAHNGRDAWDRLVAIKKKAEEENRPVTDYVQAVVSDIEMPCMDGHNLCKRIKEDNALQVLPVVLFSSLITDRLRHKGEDVGADDQFAKPEVTQLAKRVHELIAERKAAGLM